MVNGTRGTGRVELPRIYPSIGRKAARAMELFISVGNESTLTPKNSLAGRRPSYKGLQLNRGHSSSHAAILIEDTFTHGNPGMYLHVSKRTRGLDLVVLGPQLQGCGEAGKHGLQ